MQSKKITIAMMLFFVFVFGTIFSLIGLLIYKHQSNQINSNQEHRRYSLIDKIRNDEKEGAIINTFINKEETLKQNKLILKKADDTLEIELFFKEYLIIIFNLNNDYETKLKIDNLEFQDYNISLSISWYFIHKNTYIIYKNTKYYDMLKLIYKGLNNE